MAFGSACDAHAAAWFICGEQNCHAEIVAAPDCRPCSVSACDKKFDELSLATSYTIEHCAVKHRPVPTICVRNTTNTAWLMPRVVGCLVND